MQAFPIPRIVPRKPVGTFLKTRFRREKTRRSRKPDSGVPDNPKPRQGVSDSYEKNIVAAWWWDASLLTAAADENLQLIKTITGVLPFDWGSKVENALRIFGADRALLLIEGVVIGKVIMLSIAYPFRHRRP